MQAQSGTAGAVAAALMYGMDVGKPPCDWRTLPGTPRRQRIARHIGYTKSLPRLENHPSDAHLGRLCICPVKLGERPGGSLRHRHAEAILLDGRVLAALLLLFLLLLLVLCEKGLGCQVSGGVYRTVRGSGAAGMRRGWYHGVCSVQERWLPGPELTCLVLDSLPLAAASLDHH